MPIGNKVLIVGINRTKSFLPISTAHLSFCDQKPQVIKLPKENNVLSDIIEQRMFEKFPDIVVFQNKNSKSLVDIYKSVQRKYYPEKDIYQKGEI